LALNSSSLKIQEREKVFLFDILTKAEANLNLIIKQKLKSD